MPTIDRAALDAALELLQDAAGWMSGEGQWFGSADNPFPLMYQVMLAYPDDPDAQAFVRLYESDTDGKLRQPYAYGQRDDPIHSEARHYWGMVTGT